MAFGRILLWSIGLMLVGFGLAYLVAPVGMVALTGVVAATPAAITDARATYGGFQIGFGAFLLWCALAPQRIPAGLVALGLTAGAIALGRGVGLALDRDLGPTLGIGPVHVSALVFEIATALLAFLALARSRAQ